MFAVAVLAYLTAVVQRTSLGVSAVEATERFEINAATLSTLVVVQILVYALLQVPVGVVLDRTGPRLLLVVGAILMALGQLTLAFAPSVGVALLARVLVGAGDAMTFISAVRFLSNWFDGKMLPIVTQLLGTAGAFGQVLSALPLAVILHSWGWSPAYVSAASLSVVIAVILVLAVRGPVLGDAPPRVESWAGSLGHLRDALRRPGTQLGFWAHFVMGTSITMFSLLWGFPFLSVGLGYGPAGAAALFTMMVVSVAVTGPLIGILSARFPLRRSNLILAIIATLAVLWAVVLAWPGQPPLALVIALLIVLALSGSASLIGIDFARTFNPLRAHGSATGVVNVGGFTSGFAIMLMVGVLLDVIDRSRGGTGIPSELYSLESFRLAFIAQYLVMGVGVGFLLHARRRTRHRLFEEEGITVGPLWVALVRAWRDRSDSDDGKRPRQNVQ